MLADEVLLPVVKGTVGMHIFLDRKKIALLSLLLS